MKYDEHEVLDILKYSGFDNPDKILKLWKERKSNTLPKDNYNTFVYSFPLIVNEEEVATITFVSLYGTNNYLIDDLMLKYFGNELYDLSYMTFSHDTYMHCYLTIHKQFELSEICKGFNGDIFIGKDSKGNDFGFKVSIGCPDNEDDSYLYNSYVDDKSYRFDNGVNITVERIVNGWNLSDKIKENIKKRIREFKIKSLVK